jgi:hypothetical protein
VSFPIFAGVVEKARKAYDPVGIEALVVLQRSREEKVRVANIDGRDIKDIGRRIALELTVAPM